MITTVLFDFDGTIGNTNELIFDSFKYVFEKYGIAYTEKDVLDGFGPTLYDTFKKYGKDELEINEMIASYREFNIPKHDSYVKPFDGVVETLEKLHEMGIKMGVVTSKKTDLARHGVELIGVSPYIDCVIGSNEVKNPKPNPEGVLLALETLGRKTCLLVGDNSSDIYSAKNALCLSCGVSWTVKWDELVASNPDFMIQKMEELVDIVQNN